LIQHGRKRDFSPHKAAIGPGFWLFHTKIVTMTKRLQAEAGFQTEVSLSDVVENKGNAPSPTGMLTGGIVIAHIGYGQLCEFDA